MTYLESFQVLIIMNNFVRNIHVQLFLGMLSILLGTYLQVELLSHVRWLYLSLREIAKLFNKVAAPFYISISKGLQYHSWLKLIISLFDYSQLMVLKWYHILVLICISLMLIIYLSTYFLASSLST